MRVAGAGPAFLLKDTGQEALLAARYDSRTSDRDRGARVPRRRRRLPRRARGSCPRRPGSATRVRGLAAELGLDFASVPPPPDVAAPGQGARLGVWVPWADTDSIGWIRYALDERSVPYSTCATKTFARAACGTESTSLFTVTSTWSWPSRSRAFRKRGPDALQEDARRPRAHGPAASPTTSPAASAGKDGRDPEFVEERRCS